MSDPRPTLAERWAECCPCLRRQTHSDSSFGPCKDRSCRCYFMGDGVDACLWPGHAVEAEVGEMDTALRTTQKWLRASRERAEAAEARLAAIIGAHQGPMESCAERIKVAEALLREATAKLQRVRDALVSQANSEGGLVAEVDKVQRGIRDAGG